MKRSIMRISLLAAVSLLATAPAFCGFEASSTLVTGYVWRGFEVLNRGPAIQPSLTYALEETGLSLNAWGSWAVTQRANSGIRQLDELDYTLSYSRTLGSYDLALAYIYYTFPGMPGCPDEFSTNSEANFGVGFSSLPFQPGVSVYYALNEDSWDGLYLSISAGKTLETSAAPLNIGLSLGYSHQSLVTDLTDAGISDINLSVDTQLESLGLFWVPAFTLTYTPLKEVYSDYFMFWGGLTVGLSR